MAMAAGKNRIAISDSPAFRKANHDAMEAIKQTIGGMKADIAKDRRRGPK